MKFWKRLLLLGSALFLVGTVYYYVALDMSGADQDLRLQQKERVLGLEDTPLASVLSHLPRHLQPEVCARRPGQPLHLSTLHLFFEADFSILPDGMYQLPTPPPVHPNSMGGTEDESRGVKDGSDTLEPLNVIIMPHSHNDPGWQKTTSEYYADHTKHILNNMVNKLTEHPDLTFVWAEVIFFSMWWEELDDSIKVHVRRLIRRGQLEVVGGGWVMADEAATHYVSLIDQLLEGHQWLWNNLRVAPVNSWAIDPFGHSATMPYLWKLAGVDNMVIQRVHQAVKASLMSRRSLEFYWRQLWDEEGATDILCHMTPYMLYSIKFSCGPNRFVCLLFDFRSIPGLLSDSRAQAITPANVEKFAQYLYEQFRQKSYFYKYNTILVPVGDDFRYDKELEWDQQYGNYSLLMNYMNGRKDWKVNVTFGTLKDYFRLTRADQQSKKLTEQNNDFPVLSGDFFPYSDRNLDYWTGYYSTRPFDKRFQREVQGMIQAGDIAVTLTLALYKGWGLRVQEKFFQLSSLMQTAHRGQAQFLHHDAITGTAKDFVVLDFEAQLLAAFRATQSVLGMVVQALSTKGRVETPHVLRSETVRHGASHNAGKERLEVTAEGLLLQVFNPLAQHRRQPVHLLVSTHQLTVRDQHRRILPCQINPVWLNDEVVGVEASVYELVFVADLPPLASVPFMVFAGSSLPGSSQLAQLTVFNSDTLVVPPHTLFPHQQPQATRSQPVEMNNDVVTVRVDPSSGRLVDMEDRQTGRRTQLHLGLEVYRSQGSGAYLFQPERGGSQPLISNAPLVRMVEGPIVSQLTVVYAPYVTQTFSLYHHPALLASALHVHNELNIQTLKDREVVMRMKTDLQMKETGFFSDQNAMQYMWRRTNDNTSVEANYYPVTSGAFVEDGQRRVSLLMGQPHGASSLQAGWLEVMLDRHVTRDDGRGMEEGVRDIKPAVSDFVLLVEAPADNGTSPYPQPQHAFPSLLSLALGDRLQQPVQVLFSQVTSDVFFAGVQPFEVALPCDLALLSLRSLPTEEHVYNGTSLVLHRRAYDCRFPPPRSLACSLGGPPLTFQALFKGVGTGVRAVTETSLTHLHHKRSLPLDSVIALQPMQIASYRIVF